MRNKPAYLGALAAIASAVGCATLIGLDPPDHELGGSTTTMSTGGSTTTATTTSTGGSTTTTTTSTGGSTTGPSCDGGTPCSADADCNTGSTTACLVSHCTAGCCGAPVPAPQGTTCNDHGGTTCNATGTCTTSGCADGIQDGDETDVDCGGATCPACGDGKVCIQGTDCKNKICTGGDADAGTKGTCAEPSCDDGVQNGNETDVDCGGTAYAEPADGGVDAGPFAACSPCQNTKKCNGNTDCVSINCVSNVCTAKANGANCSTAAECGTGAACMPDDTNTSDTICCASSCTAASTASCGQDGNCKHDGSACADYSASTQCSAPSCAGAVYTPPADCNGGGTCPAVTPTTCTGTDKLCNAAKGCVQCNANSDCPAASCNSTIYTPAATCDSSNNCLSGASTACSGSAPVCNAAKGCVQCNTNNDCPAASCNSTIYTPAATCDSSNNCLIGASTACAAPTPACSAQLGCVQCNVNSDCPAASCSGATWTSNQVCNTSNVCVGGTTRTCSGFTPLCNPALGCIECNTDSNCAGLTSVCDITTGSCVQCVASGDSVASTGDCISKCCNGSCSSGTTCQ